MNEVLLALAGVVIGAGLMMLWRLKTLERRNVELAKKIHDSILDSEHRRIKSADFQKLISWSNERAKKRGDFPSEE